MKASTQRLLMTYPTSGKNSTYSVYSIRKGNAFCRRITLLCLKQRKYLLSKARNLLQTVSWILWWIRFLNNFRRHNSFSRYEWQTCRLKFERQNGLKVTLRIIDFGDDILLRCLTQLRKLFTTGIRLNGKIVCFRSRQYLTFDPKKACVTKIGEPAEWMWNKYAWVCQWQKLKL